MNKIFLYYKNEMDMNFKAIKQNSVTFHHSNVYTDVAANNDTNSKYKRGNGIKSKKGNSSSL